MEGNIFAPVVPRGQTVPTIKKRQVHPPPMFQFIPSCDVVVRPPMDRASAPAISMLEGALDLIHLNCGPRHAFYFLLCYIAATIHTMAFPATDMLEVLVLITWACLLQPVHKNGLFKQFFFDQAVLFEICSAVSLSFRPGLFEAIQAARPPDVSFFRNLPSDSRRRWAVYALVLEKSGAVPLIYIGSGTDMTRGVPARWTVHDRPDANRQELPENARRALSEGYKIVYKGSWCGVRPILLQMLQGSACCLWQWRLLSAFYSGL